MALEEKIVKMKVDINCDLGEGKTLSDCQHDSLLMPYISSCNIACGGHSGNNVIMRETLISAAHFGLKIGAHPGYPDKDNFGRLSIQISKHALNKTLTQQIESLTQLALELNIELHHIKFHGALYNDIETTDELAFQIANFCKTNYPNLKVMGLAAGKLQHHCHALSIDFIAEGFMDRTYLANGKLTPRSQTNALLEKTEDVIEQALFLAKNLSINTSDNSKLTPLVQSICLHGDNPNALNIAKQLLVRLQDSSIQLDYSSNKNCYTYKILNNGDSAFSIIFDEPISECLSRKIESLAKEFQNELAEYINELIPSYQSLTVCYNPLADSLQSINSQINNSQINSSQAFEQLLHQLIQKKDYLRSGAPFLENYSTANLIEIPVCYEDEFAPDMAKVAEYSGLTKQQIITLHSEPEYLVHMLGFLPGFLYLGGLNKQLFCPRKETPNYQIKAGAVGIGGHQTGIYPVESPGGWQIIGRTPLQMFSPDNKPPTIASALDRIKFVAISKAEFYRLENHKLPSGDQMVRSST